MIMYHLGPQLGVWIMQVSTFSSVQVPLYIFSENLLAIYEDDDQNLF